MVEEVVHKMQMLRQCWRKLKQRYCTKQFLHPCHCVRTLTIRLYIECLCTAPGDQGAYACAGVHEGL